MPLIITKDDIGSSWMTNAYLNVRFQQQRTDEEKSKGGVSPLVSMSVGTVERAIAPLQKMALSDILRDRITEEPFLGRPFEAASSYVRRGMPRMMFKHIEIMHEMTTELTTNFKMVEE
jgi:hypothetical protein